MKKPDGYPKLYINDNNHVLHYETMECERGTCTLLGFVVPPAELERFERLEEFAKELREHLVYLAIGGFGQTSPAIVDRLDAILKGKK